MKRRIVISIALAGALALELILISKASAPGCAWNPVASPSLGGSAQLASVFALSPSDVWAAGASNDALIEHWDGNAWAVVPSPKLGRASDLLGISGASPSDIWAVGDYGDNVAHTLTEHWDGHSWMIVPSPNPYQNKHAYLSGVYAISSSDVWAVGESGHTLVEHWDGHSWTIVPSPNGGFANYLYGVSGTSSTDVWAAGFFQQGHQGIKTITEHWDGHVWRVVQNPHARKHFSYFFAISAISKFDVWAVGITGDSTSTHTLTQNWNGRAWVYVSSPNPPGDAADYLAGVSATSSSDVWAVGEARSTHDPSSQTIIEHWNGHAWSLVPSANQGFINFLVGVSADSPSDAWAAGFYSQTQDPTYIPLIEHWSC